MLAITVSLLFALAAAAAIAVLRSSVLIGSARARLILAELAEIDREARATRPVPALLQPRPALAAA